VTAECLDCKTSSRGKCVIHLEQEPIKHDCTKEECRQLFDNTSDETDGELDRLRAELASVKEDLRVAFKNNHAVGEFMSGAFHDVTDEVRKQLRSTETERDRLAAENRRLQAMVDGSGVTVNHELERLTEENRVLKNRVEELEEDLAYAAKALERVEDGDRSKVEIFKAAIEALKIIHLALGTPDGCDK
jgi:polyhydroxyalkanoate synthesis regulator phasin